MSLHRGTTKLLLFSDTHVRGFEQLHPVIKEALKEADWVVHCGDFTGPELVHHLMSEYPRFVAVYGNTDKDETRHLLPAKQHFAIGGWRIGMIHPWWGAESDGVEERVCRELGPQDLVLFGHIHERVNRHRGNTLVVNPGPGYAEFMTPGSLALLTLRETSIDVEFRIFEH